MAAAPAAELGEPRESGHEQEAFTRSINRGAPFGSEQWTIATVKRLALESTIRAGGRPRKSLVITKTVFSTFVFCALHGNLSDSHRQSARRIFV